MPAPADQPSHLKQEEESVVDSCAKKTVDGNTRGMGWWYGKYHTSMLNHHNVQVQRLASQ